MTRTLTLSARLNLTMPRTRNAASVPENPTIPTPTQAAESPETIRERKKALLMYYPFNL